MRTLAIVGLMLLSALGADDVIFQPKKNSFAEEVARYMDVYCGSSEMLIIVDFNNERQRISDTMAGTLRNGTFCLPGNVTECCTTINETSVNHALHIRYGMCDVMPKNTYYGLNYSTVVTFFNPRYNQETKFSLSCTVPLNPQNDLEYTFLLSQKDKPVPSTNINGTDYAHFSMADQVYARLIPHAFGLPAYIHAYPLHCSMSPEHGQKRRVLFMGCPVPNGRSMFLSALFQSETYGAYATSTELYLNMIPSTIPTNYNTATKHYDPFYFSCSFFACSGNRRHAVYRMPTCPSAGRCQRIQPGQKEARQDPDLYEDAPIIRAAYKLPFLVSSTISQEPLLLRSPVYEGPILEAVREAELKFEQEELEEQRRALAARPEELFSMDARVALIFISLVSFLLGIGCVMTLWFIQEKIGERCARRKVRSVDTLALGRLRQETQTGGPNLTSSYTQTERRRLVVADDTPSRH